MKGTWERGGTAPLMEVRVQLDAPAALPTRKSFLVPFEYEDGWVTYQI
jgi:hypothetical protein